MKQNLTPSTPYPTTPQSLFAFMRNLNKDCLTDAIWMFFIDEFVNVTLSPDNLLALVKRVEFISMREDEPRFTNYDYFYAIANLIDTSEAPADLVQQLLEMDPEKFIEKIVSLAEEDRGHYS